MLFFARRYNLFHDIVIGYFIVIFIRVWLRFLKTYGIYKKKLEAASSPAAADESRQHRPRRHPEEKRPLNRNSSPEPKTPPNRKKNRNQCGPPRNQYP